jgi:single-strand DNA-binding protein
MSKATLEIEGYVAQTPELKFSQSGDALLNVTVPHTPRRKNRDTGEFEDAGETLWVRFTLWREDAYRYADLLVKGTHVTVAGEPELRKWENGDKHGADLQIKFPRVSIIPPKGSNDRANTSPSAVSGNDSWNAPAEWTEVGNVSETPF